MNKKQVIENVNAVLPALTIKQAETAVNVTLQSIANGLERDGIVILTKFGTFKVRDVAQRIARNPGNGTEVLVPAHKRAVFKAAKAVADRLNNR